MGIAYDTTFQFRSRIGRFNRKYVHDWAIWLATPALNRPPELKRILGKWQACRGNTLRLPAGGSHTTPDHPPYLDDLLIGAGPHILTLKSFDLRFIGSYTPAACAALRGLWDILEDLSYARSNPSRKRPPPRGGKAGIVGISKATLLITEGRVGPAFDSQVRKKLGIRQISNASEWLKALQQATADIMAFEVYNGVTLLAASGLSPCPHPGRVYDMALGP